MFNRHDVMKLADAIRGAYTDADPEEQAGVSNTARNIGFMLQDEIPGFDMDEFMQSCIGA